jgi:hypothetical protein
VYAITLSGGKGATLLKVRVFVALLKNRVFSAFKIVGLHWKVSMLTTGPTDMLFVA